jgi:hypothetical protein
MRLTPNRSVSSRCWQTTLSYIVTCGNAARSSGGGVLLGDEDRPLPNMFGTTMKYLAGSIARPGAMTISLSR